MNRLDVQQAGGFPMTTDILNEMQDTYGMINGLAAMAGKLAIISGCEETGNNVSNGIVQINGEAFNFKGGAKLATVVIVEEKTQKEFKDGTQKYVVYNRYVRFGSGTQNYNWADFKRIQRAFLPAGLISMWAGTANAIPAGWALCDGTNGTPDLRGRFIVGYNSDDTDYNAIGKTGGSKEVTLNTTQLPAHNHTTSSDGSHTHNVSFKSGESDHPEQAGNDLRALVGVDTVTATTSSSGAHSHTINNTGGGQAHENRPPYYTLAFIQFKG